jgi:predicted O-methyltransferase YrrM
MMAQSLRLSRKARALLVDRDAGARMRHKLETWADRFAIASAITDVDSAPELDRIFARFIPPSAPLRDSQISLLESQIEASRCALSTGPFPIDGLHNGTVTLGRLCYLACRHLRPNRIVETGVAYGVTSAYMLQALTENKEGELSSIDLPPLFPEAQRYVGSFVPQRLRTRWKLHIGPARRLLPSVLREVGTIDMFVHDSLHTYSHMKWEFETALCSLRPGGVLISDDIEGNRAFEELTRHPSVASWFAIRQEGKDAICGAVRTRI